MKSDDIVRLIDKSLDFIEAGSALARTAIAIHKDNKFNNLKSANYEDEDMHNDSVNNN
jgi:hypothetical protein